MRRTFHRRPWSFLLLVGLAVLSGGKAAPAQTVTVSAESLGQFPSAPVSAEAPAGDPQTTMFPHPEGGRFWLSGQANVIFQGRLPFHSPYQGPNSFRNSAEYKASMIETLYAAVRPSRSIRYNTDLILDLESAGGRGLSEALGLAGFTNLDVVRNPSLGSKPYVARYEFHQVIGLTDKISNQEPNFFAPATSVPDRRFEFRLGKMTLPDFFDVNDIGSDSHLQFMNWTADNNGAWDYAADTRGYTVAARWSSPERSPPRCRRTRRTPSLNSAAAWCRSARGRRGFCSTPTAHTWGAIARR